MRMYQEIWEKLKRSGTCVIEAPTEYHPRIVRMVSKEKDTDAAFKLEILEDSGSTKVARIRTKKSGSRIIFTLFIERF